MAKAKLTFYYDIGSPFAYMAYYLLRNSPVFHQVDITYTPMLLGGILKMCGNRPPLEIKNKDKWIELERQRWTKMYGIPIAGKAPDGFPLSTLLIQRTLTAISLAEPLKLLAATDAIWAAFWGNSNVKKVNEVDGLTAVLTEALGEEKAKHYVSNSSSADVKQQLLQNTQLAFDDGVFGLPYFVATNSAGERENYWGFDHLGQVLDHLGLERPMKQDGWRAML